MTKIKKAPVLAKLLKYPKADPMAIGSKATPLQAPAPQAGASTTPIAIGVSIIDTAQLV